MTRTLSPKHLAHLRLSAISDEVIQERGYYTEDDVGKIEALGFSHSQSLPGLIIPVWTADGRNGQYILRPDNPRCFEDKKKPRNPDGSYHQKVNKYENPKGSSIRIDCPPRCRPNLKDPKTPLWITEGTKKADALASAGVCAISLPGVWGFKGTNDLGGVTWQVDWDYIALAKREVNIVFDSDVMTKPEVKQALERLTIHLSNKGAKVNQVYLPPGVNGKNGVDDYLAAGHTLAELQGLATSPRQATSTPKVTSKDYYDVLMDLGYSFRMNMLTDIVEINGIPFTDNEEAIVLTQFRDRGFNNIAGIKDAITAFALKYKHHPILNYLDGLPNWDGGPYIETLASCVKTCEKNFSTLLKRWLIGAVRRVRMGGAQNRVLVLSGDQNIGKSKLVKWLCPDKLRAYYIASPIYPDFKDQKLALMSKWIWEVAELGNTTRKADREALKFFLTLEQISERLPYGKRPVTKPALTSFIGTLNDEGGVLTDPTGSRRFMFVKVTDIDWRYYTQNISTDQVWAEADFRYRQGEDADLTADEAKAVSVTNAEFDAENPVEGMLLKYFVVEPTNLKLWTSTVEITHALLDPYKGAYHGTSDKLTKDLSSVLAGMGCIKVRKASWQNPGKLDVNYSSLVTGYHGIVEK